MSWLIVNTPFTPCVTFESVLDWTVGYTVIQLAAQFTQGGENRSKEGLDKFMGKDQPWVIKAN